MKSREVYIIYILYTNLVYRFKSTILCIYATVTVVTVVVFSITTAVPIRKSLNFKKASYPYATIAQNPKNYTRKTKIKIH